MDRIDRGSIAYVSHDLECSDERMPAGSGGEGEGRRGCLSPALRFFSSNSRFRSSA